MLSTTALTCACVRACVRERKKHNASDVNKLAATRTNRAKGGKKTFLNCWQNAIFFKKKYLLADTRYLRVPHGKRVRVVFEF